MRLRFVSCPASFRPALAAWALACVIGGAGHAAAQDNQSAFQDFELRLGGFVHDPVSPERGGADVNAEVLVSPFAAAERWYAPRFHLGTTFSTRSQRTSSAYAGLSWTFDLTSRLFAEASFGAAVHNGATGAVPIAGRNAMGCAVGFRESLSIGWRVTPRLSVMGTIEHISNAGLCAQNRGLTNAGVRLGWRF